MHIQAYSRIKNNMRTVNIQSCVRLWNLVTTSTTILPVLSTTSRPCRPIELIPVVDALEALFVSSVRSRCDLGYIPCHYPRPCCCNDVYFFFTLICNFISFLFTIIWLLFKSTRVLFVFPSWINVCLYCLLIISRIIRVSFF